MKRLLTLLFLFVSGIACAQGKLDRVENFSQIIAPHKGKVVVVDFWNTWCKSCCKALGENEQLKTGRFYRKDIVWIYVADESSPESDWRYLIRYFKGIHYRLGKDNIKHLYAELGITALPSYILVKRDGSFALRDDMRDRKEYIKAIKQEL